MNASQFMVPNFISAPTAQQLRGKMLDTNARLGAFVQYHSISYVTNGKKSEWVAWYYEKIENEIDLQSGDQKIK